MDVCKCIVPLRNGDILNSLQAASPLVRLVEGEESNDTNSTTQVKKCNNMENNCEVDEMREVLINRITGNTPSNSKRPNPIQSLICKGLRGSISRVWRPLQWRPTWGQCKGLTPGDTSSETFIKSNTKDTKSRFRRCRTRFTKHQLQSLEKVFSEVQYPSVSIREKVAAETKLSEARVQIAIHRFSAQKLNTVLEKVALNIFLKQNLFLLERAYRKLFFDIVTTIFQTLIMSGKTNLYIPSLKKDAASEKSHCCTTLCGNSSQCNQKALSHVYVSGAIFLSSNPFEELAPSCHSNDF
ncbi:UNVERIFIED_CONTAM: Homeobox protein aristaless-like 4 [Trichonephila clavipes]